MKVMRKVSGILVISAIIGTNLNAQVLNDVITVYNEGAKLVQTDAKAAIESFEKVVTLSDQVGESANDLKQKAIKVLPGLYFKEANNTMKDKKPAAEIIKASKAAIAAAEKYGNATVKANAGKVLAQGYNVMGVDYFTKKDYENALLAFDSLLAITPDNMNAIYNKALIYRGQSNDDAFEQTIDSFLGKVGGDTLKTRQASSLALEYFRAAGSKANQADSLEKALALLNKAAKYGNDKDLFYYFADVYNKQKNFDSGAEFAQKGLDLETGDAEAKAKYYYQLAVAQVGKGQNAEACASFKNSTYGAFAEASKAQRKNLKCE